jgi:hypothetical protein
MHTRSFMKPSRCLSAVLILAAVSLFACGGAQERTRDGVTAKATPTPPLPPRMGAMERQPAAPEEAEATPTEGLPGAPVTPAPGSQIGVRPDGTPVRVGTVPVPPGATLTRSVAVTEVRAFPEEIDQTSGEPNDFEATVQARGKDRLYQSAMSYQDTVLFFDNALTKDGFRPTRHVTSTTSTVWALRTMGGTTAHVAVRNTTPVTFEVIETDSTATP